MPSDELTTWLQCEGGCDKWYHIVCVGVSKDAVHTIDSYKCYKCQKPAMLQANADINRVGVRT